MAPGFLLLLLIPCLLPALAAGQQHMPSFSANDTKWLPTENRTLVSGKRDFAAGFVPSQSSPGKYRFAVWVANVYPGTNKTIIWYAHHTNNYTAFEAGATSVLAVSAAGVLSWTDPVAGNRTIWSPKLNNPTTTALALQLNDNGSLDYGAGAWSSFAEPTDTLMPGQPILNSSSSGTPTLQSDNAPRAGVHDGPDAEEPGGLRGQVPGQPQLRGVRLQVRRRPDVPPLHAPRGRTGRLPPPRPRPAPRAGTSSQWRSAASHPARRPPSTSTPPAADAHRARRPTHPSSAGQAAVPPRVQQRRAEAPVRRCRLVVVAVLGPEFMRERENHSPWE